LIWLDKNEGIRELLEEMMSDLIPDSQYTWTFYDISGDYYGGFMYADTGAYVPGQILRLTQYGQYQIGTALPYGYDFGPSIPEGTVYTTFYHDSLYGNLPTFSYSVPPQLPSTYLGLGTEYDKALVGLYWDDFGYGGTFIVG